MTKKAVFSIQKIASMSKENSVIVLQKEAKKKLLKFLKIQMEAGTTDMIN